MERLEALMGFETAWVQQIECVYLTLCQHPQGHKVNAYLYYWLVALLTAPTERLAVTPCGRAVRVAERPM